MSRDLIDHVGMLARSNRLANERLYAACATLTAADLGREVVYVNSRGHRHADPMGMLVAHLFNHQTHHRGQVHDMLTQTEVLPPSLDLQRIIKP